MGLKDILSLCFMKVKGMRYNTVQIVAIKSPTLSIIFRVCQLVIALYILISVIILKRGYQRFEPVSGTTQIKTKGSSYNAGGLPWYNYTTQPGDYTQIFDSSDLVFPPMERDATFITTNLWMQNNQSRGVCYPGSDDWWTEQYPADSAGAQCAARCQRGTLVNEAETRTGGVWTGGYTLKPDPMSELVNCYCELYTWCPDENIPKIPGPYAFHLMGIENWTVSFRQNVEFRQFHAVTNNLQPKDGNTPPIYTVEQMLAEAGVSYEQVRQRGAVLVMSTEWDCNLDYSVDSCLPTARFELLGTSFNFRRTEYLTEQGMEGRRQLIKHFGLRIIMILSGHAGKFEPAALFTTIGAGIGLLAVASLVADFAAVNVLGQRELYEKAKFKEVEVEGTRVRGLSESVRGKPTSSADVELGTTHPVSAAIMPVSARPSDAEEPWGRRAAE